MSEFSARIYGRFRGSCRRPVQAQPEVSAPREWVFVYPPRPHRACRARCPGSRPDGARARGVTRLRVLPALAPAQHIPSIPHSGTDAHRRVFCPFTGRFFRRPVRSQCTNHPAGSSVAPASLEFVEYDRLPSPIRAAPRHVGWHCSPPTFDAPAGPWPSREPAPARPERICLGPDDMRAECARKLQRETPGIRR